MLYPSINELRKKADSKYTLVSLAALRARGLIDGKPSLTANASCSKPVSIAAQEIYEDLIKYNRDGIFDDDDSAEKEFGYGYDSSVMEKPEFDDEEYGEEDAPGFLDVPFHGFGGAVPSDAFASEAAARAAAEQDEDDDDDLVEIIELAGEDE